MTPPSAAPSPGDLQIRIAPNVALGGACDLQPPCIIGKPPRGAGEGERELTIGAGAIVRPFTTIYAGSVIGDRLQTGQGASIREDNILGDDVSIGTNAVLEFGNRIGSRVRIHSGCFLELVTIEDDVFVGPNVVFTDDPHPMGCPRYQDCKGEPWCAVWRASAPTAPSCRVSRSERGSVVGAGSVVVHDVPPGAVVAGNPARVIKQVAELTCPPGWFEHPYTWPPYAELTVVRSRRGVRGSHRSPPRAAALRAAGATRLGGRASESGCPAPTSSPGSRHTRHSVTANVTSSSVLRATTIASGGGCMSSRFQ